MKRILALFTAGLMAAAAVPAVAQTTSGGQSPSGSTLMDTGSGTGTGGAEIGSGTDTEAGAEAGTVTDMGEDTGIDPGTTAATGDQANFGSVISAIRSGDMETDFSTVTDESKINVVRVDSLSGATEDPQALENAVSQNQAQVDELRIAIEGNQTVMAKLETEGVQASNVVATEMGDDGMLTVYVQ